jgi:hypothetical protein
MLIVNKNGNRVLSNDEEEDIYVNDGNIIRYTGMYHKIINDIVKDVKIETTFIGKVVCEKYRHDEGIVGIYVEPLYIFNMMYDEWNKIINYKPPNGNKYFLYPHLLLVKEPRCFTLTKNISFDDFASVVKCIDLAM